MEGLYEVYNYVHVIILVESWCTNVSTQWDYCCLLWYIGGTAVNHRLGDAHVHRAMCLDMPKTQWLYLTKQVNLMYVYLNSSAKISRKECSAPQGH